MCFLFLFLGSCHSSNIVVVSLEGVTDALPDQGLRASSLSELVSINRTPVHVRAYACPLSRPDIESVTAAAGDALPVSSSRLEPLQCPDPPWGANDRRDGCDVVSSLLTSPDRACNIFSNDNYFSFLMLLESHGIHTDAFATASECRLALLTHVMSGVCVGPAMGGHTGCASAGRGFDSTLDIAYYSVSVVISSPRVCPASVLISAVSIGFDIISGATGCGQDSGQDAARDYLIAKRRALVADYSYEHPSELLLDSVEYLKLPALIALASLHRLSVYKPSLEGMRRLLVEHVASGECAVRSRAVHSVACASVFDQTFPGGMPDETTSEELKDIMQINLLTYLMPRLTRAACRRILTLHGVEWKASQGVASLRAELKRYLDSFGALSFDPVVCIPPVLTSSP